MKLYRISGIGTACAAALLALVAGVSTGSAQPTVASPTAATQQVNVVLQRGAIGYTPGHVGAGRMTLVVHNGRNQTTTFIVADHKGGMLTLPRYSGMPFIPREEIVGHLTRLTPGSQRRLTITLAEGNYAVLTSRGPLGGDGPIVVDSAVRFEVG
jgi:hypothetical protein